MKFGLDNYSVKTEFNPNKIKELSSPTLDNFNLTSNGTFNFKDSTNPIIVSSSPVQSDATLSHVPENEIEGVYSNRNVFTANSKQPEKKVYFSKYKS